MACNGQSKPEKENISDETQSVLSNEPENVPVHLNKVQFLDKVADYEKNPDTWVYRGDKPAIIDFYATWCGPCKAVAPILDDLAKEYKDQIYIYKIDTDQEQELAADFGIRSIPSLLFIPMSGQPQMIQGAIGKEEFKKIIDEFLLKEKLRECLNLIVSGLRAFFKDVFLRVKTGKLSKRKRKDNLIKCSYWEV